MMRTIRSNVDLARYYYVISSTYHEAGHTIYALLHYMKVYLVRVFHNKKDKRIQGFTHYLSPEVSLIKDPKLITVLLQNEIKLCYAGIAAEKYQHKLHSGSDKFPTFLDGSSEDLSEASKMIKKYNLAEAGKRRYNYKKKMIRQVIRELQDYWEEVIIVAHGLCQKKRLSYEDLKQLLMDKTERQDFWKKQFSTIDHLYFSDSEMPNEPQLRSILY